jgi:hypothetical protein
LKQIGRLTDYKKVLCNKLVLNFCKYNIVTWKLYDIKIVKTLWVATTLQTLTQYPSSTFNFKNMYFVNISNVILKVNTDYILKQKPHHLQKIMLFVKYVCDYLPMVTNKTKFRNTLLSHMQISIFSSPGEVPHSKIIIM